MRHYAMLIAFIFLAATTVCLAGCNTFKLRGNYSIPTYLKTVYITPFDPYHPFQRELRYRLKRANVTVVNCPGPNTTMLELGQPAWNEQILAYSSSGQVQRSKLTYSVHYRLVTKDSSDINESRTVSRTRELSKSNNELLTNDIEESIVRKELQNETVGELLRQITTRPRYKASMPDSSTIDNSPC